MNRWPEPNSSLELGTNHFGVVKSEGKKTNLLHAALLKNAPAYIVRLILQKSLHFRMDVRCDKEMGGRTPLHLAILHSTDEEIITLLLNLCTTSPDVFKEKDQVSLDVCVSQRNSTDCSLLHRWVERRSMQPF